MATIVKQVQRYVDGQPTNVLSMYVDVTST